MNIFLDDIRNPKDAFPYTKRDAYLKKYWHVIRNYTEFTMMVETYFKSNKKLPDIISFDHDLGNKEDDTSVEKTGYECAKWLVEFCMDNSLHLPTCYVHSMNPVGSKNITMLFENYTKSREINGG